jgi:riboflavin kinase / FMN adenylyltransferase
MKIHYGYENLQLTRPVVTLGIFDGVHRGHRLLLNRLVNKAMEVDGESVVITFHPHPRIVLDQNSSSLTFLTTMDEKIEILENFGIDHLIIIEFNRDFSMISACDFVKDILVGKIGTRYLMFGYDHHFGRKGEGDLNTIRKCTESLDFSIEKVEGLESGSGIISSSLVREALLAGKVEEAADLLGYFYSLTGAVIEGKKLGRAIGFPTANILPSDSHKLVPLNGVYAVEVDLDGKRYPGMLNIGSNPTVNNDVELRSIEVNIIGFDGDIYGSVLSLRFIRRLRDEIRFSSIGELVARMEIDKQDTLRILSAI